MIRLTGPKAEVIKALALLSQGEQKWFQTELILQKRMEGKEFNAKTYRKSTENLLEKCFLHVPKLVERRVVAAGYSWSLTPAGVAVAATQLEVKT